MGNINTNVLLASTKKLMAVRDGQDEQDDRDSLNNQSFHSAEDFFPERIEKDMGNIYKALWKSTNKGKLTLQPGLLTGQLNNVLLGSGVASPLEEINPIDIYDQRVKVTRMGEGAIGSDQAIPMEARAVQPTYLNFIDMIRSPESARIGVDVRAASNAMRSDSGQIAAPFVNVATGETETLTGRQAFDSVVAFPGELDDPEAKYVRASYRGAIKYVPRTSVQHVLPSAQSMFNTSMNMVPLFASAQGNRPFMASKNVNQVLALENPEAPLVQSLSDVDGKSYNEIMGNYAGNVRAKTGGLIVEQDADQIVVQQDDGKRVVHDLYNQFPLNRKAFLHNTALTEIGQRVEPGQLLARSNYTDKDGNLAQGRNLRVALIPSKGDTYEDAYVVSEDTAHKMASEHMYQHELENEEGMRFGRGTYESLFPGKYTKEQLDKLDENGRARAGQVLQYGDPIALAVGQAKDKGEGQWSALLRKGRRANRDRSLTWEHPFPGLVTDVVDSKGGGVNVAIRAYVPLEVGDKITGLHGDKGVVSRIVPNDLMLRDKDGNPYDLIQNPATVPSRKNPSQIYEMNLAKIAKARGLPYVLPPKNGTSNWQFVQDELKKAGLPGMAADEDGTIRGSETVYNPEDGTNVDDVTTGYKYIMKAHHTSESKEDARAQGGYTAEGTPTSGHGGGKSLANLGLNALLSHGATEFIRDSKVFRSNSNDEFWSLYRKGMAPSAARVPLVYEKMLAHLKGAGVNLRQEGDRTYLLAMTDKDVDDLAPYEITSDKTLDPKTMEPIKGGLFDRGITGGVDGKKWGKIVLPTAVPNPVMEEPIRRLLGLTEKRMRGILSGEETLNARTGGAAIQEALSRLDVDKQLQTEQENIRRLKGANRDSAIKKFKYLTMMKNHGLKPQDFMLSKIPVLPPIFRPITPMGDKGAISADANYLYSDLLQNIGMYKEVKTELGDIPGSMNSPTLSLYDSVKAVTGLGDPIPAKLQEKQVGGLLRHVFGKSSPKFGLVQRRVIGMNADFVGRGVISPDSDLKLDQIGLPEDSAWESYDTFVVRRLARQGVPAAQAALEVEKRSDLAKRALLVEMENRPIVATRAPVLSRLGMMGFKPVLVSGRTIRTNPLITTGMCADYDGDQQQNSTLIRFSSCIAKTQWYIDGHLANLKENQMTMNNDCGTVWRKGDEVYVVDFEDFPHGELVREGAGVDNHIDFYSVPEGVEVLSANGDGSLCWAPVAYWTVHKGRKLEIVTTNSGDQLFTDDDPRAILGVVPGETEMSRATPSEALAKGMMIPRSIRLPIDDAATITEINANNDLSKSAKARRLKDKLQLTEEFGYALGVVCGDGWVSKSTGAVDYSQLHICGLDADVFAAFDKAINSLFDDGRTITPTIHHREGQNTESGGYGAVDRATYSSANLALLFHRLLGHTAGHKHLPPFWMAAPVAFRRGLLGGLMDTDGSISVSKAKSKNKPQLMANFTSISLRLVREVRLLMASLGIRARITPFTYRGDRTGYCLSPSNVDFLNWDSSAMHCARKTSKLSSVEKPDAMAGSAVRTDLIPIPTDIVRQLGDWVRSLGCATKTADAEQRRKYSVYTMAKKNGYGSRAYLQKIVDDGFTATGPQAEVWLSWLRNTSITWDQVTEVEKTDRVEVGYDLTVPGHECFYVASGLLASNTMSFHVPVTNAASQEVLNKMLPSKHLFHPRDFKVHQLPEKEFLFGLNVTTRAAADDDQAEHRFATKEDAIKALEAGELKPTDKVVIGVEPGHYRV